MREKWQGSTRLEYLTFQGLAIARIDAASRAERI
jgi:hypothetical protein